MLVAASLMGSTAALAAPAVKPWTPPNADSLIVWSSQAKSRFRANTGDSVGGSNFRAYEIVGSMGRRLFASLGPSAMIQAHAVEAVLDSLGLDTEVAIDPSQPRFALLLVRNPYRYGAAAVGYLYWYRDRDLRQQGVIFHGSHRPRMRVWWTARTETPYEWGIVTEDPAMARLGLLLLRLNSTATFWVLVQYEEAGPDLGGPGEAAWVEVNGAAPPELSVWTEAEAESTFEECSECPRLMLERLYVERPQGFELFDSRLLPSPYAAFTLFIRLLQQQNRTAAARLLEKPERVSEAVAAGWARVGRGVWKIEHAEEGEAWPRRLTFRFQGPKGPVRYAVRFTQRDGRWLIADWVVPTRASLGKGISP